MIRGIVFDKDGTLLDFNGTWLGAYFEATEFIATSLGRPELARRLMVEGGYIEDAREWEPDSLLASGSNAQILSFWSEIIGNPISGDQEAEMRQIFGKATYVPAVENMGTLLVELTQAGMVLGLATMDDEENARGMLAKFGLEELFGFVCGADSGYGNKPEPGMIDAFCRHQDLGYDEVIVVGDSPKDLNMGKNAGVGCSVGVLTGAHKLDELEPWADIVLQDISLLPALVEEINRHRLGGDGGIPDRFTGIVGA